MYGSYNWFSWLAKHVNNFEICRMTDRPASQGFNWESHKHDWWRNLEKKVPDVAKSGFTSVWLPPASQSFSPEGLTEKLLQISNICFIIFACGSVFLISIKLLYCFAGYLPQNLYSLNSSYGSEHLLKNLLQKLNQHKVRAMADIVINHRVGTTQGHGGMYNRYDGIPLSWNEHAVTSCTGGLVRSFIVVSLIFMTLHECHKCLSSFTAYIVHSACMHFHVSE